MSGVDIRWKQRLENYKKALDQFNQAIKLSRERALNDLEKQGLIQAFEFTHELAWNVMKDYFDYQGTNTITGSRDATREAFQRGIISNGDQWMEMIKSRNQTTHTYNKITADEIVNRIQSSYSDLFNVFYTKMLEISLR
jgi:nucleotidyltransferase substrate binding protein (TIGR01987 family)